MNPDIKRDVEAAVKILREAGAREVFIFGSAGHGTERPDSDLDLAVKGLPPEKFFEAMGTMVFELSRTFDLVDLDERNPFTEYLERKGGLVRVA